MNSSKIIKLKIFLLSIVIIFSGFYIFKYSYKRVYGKHSLITQISSRLFDFNSFDLSVESNLDINDFKIINSEKTIFEKGKYLKGIENVYGWRLFEIYYRNIKIYEFGHSSNNNWYTFKYKLNISNINNQIKPNVSIKGLEDIKELYFKKFEYNQKQELKKIHYLSSDMKIYNSEAVYEFNSNIELHNYTGDEVIKSLDRAKKIIQDIWLIKEPIPVIENGIHKEIDGMKLYYVDFVK